MSAALDRLSELEAEATPGPWKEHSTWAEPYDSEHHITAWLDDGNQVVVAGNYDYESGGIIHPADATFIAAARNALPALLAVARAAEELRVAVDRLNWTHPAWVGEKPEAVVAATDAAVRRIEAALAALDAQRGDGGP